MSQPDGALVLLGSRRFSLRSYPSNLGPLERNQRIPVSVRSPAAALSKARPTTWLLLGQGGRTGEARRLRALVGDDG